MPPCPWLSARMMIVAYLSVTIVVTDQKISERMPTICSGVSASGPSARKQSRKV